MRVGVWGSAKGAVRLLRVPVAKACFSRPVNFEIPTLGDLIAGTFDGCDCRSKGDRLTVPPPTLLTRQGRAPASRGHKQPFVAKRWLVSLQTDPCSCSPLLDISELLKGAIDDASTKPAAVLAVECGKGPQTPAFGH
ncbi:hypothetical protein EYF80_021541 [Liparis tanakae]|uniref:Uncharacterized protein n=1 Tax=Liparis tanakae TaxID=230148 RepID=A0A4Z2HQV0_9TELE|nr:hypothetical protein EYF80_021541 [Liparis tanakae]